MSMKLARALRGVHTTRNAVTLLRSARLASSSSSNKLSSSPQKAAFNDPFPLPLSSKSLTDQESIPEDLLPDPIPRPNESLDSLRARLNYQSRKRGTLESDLLLSTFAKESLPTMTRGELEEFDKVRITIITSGVEE